MVAEWWQESIRGRNLAGAGGELRAGQRRPAPGEKKYKIESEMKFKYKVKTITNWNAIKISPRTITSAITKGE